MEEARDQRFNLIAWQVLNSLDIKDQFFKKKGGYSEENDRLLNEIGAVPLQQCIKSFVEEFGIDLAYIEVSGDKVNNEMRQDFYKCFKLHISLDKSSDELTIDAFAIRQAIQEFIRKHPIVSPSASAKLSSGEDDKSKWSKHHVKAKFKELFHEVKDATLEDHTVKTTDLSEENLKNFVKQAVALREALLKDNLIKSEEPVVINAPTPEKLEKLKKLCDNQGLKYAVDAKAPGSKPAKIEEPDDDKGKEE